jgi:hypothetical protein
LRSQKQGAKGLEINRIIEGLGGTTAKEIAIYAYVKEMQQVTVGKIAEQIELTIAEVEDAVFQLECIDMLALENGVVVPAEYREMVKHGLRPIDHRKELPGEYTEEMLAVVTGGKKTSHNEKGHDIVLKDRTKIESKMARVHVAGGGKVTQYGIHGLGGNDVYDYLVAVLFPSETNYDLTKATILFVPKQEVEKIVEKKGMVRVNQSLKGRKYDWNKFKVTVQELKVIGQQGLKHPLKLAE